MNKKEFLKTFSIPPDSDFDYYKSEINIFEEELGRNCLILFLLKSYAIFLNILYSNKLLRVEQ